MTGMPSPMALATDGLMATSSWARMISDLGALRDQVLDVGGLGLGGRLGVVRDVLPAAGLDGRLDGRLIPLGPALFLVVVPRHADGAVGGGGAARRRRRWAPPRSTSTHRP